MPKPSVTKLIQLLEAHLRTSLLSRTTRRLAVTADGAAYYERAVRLLADLDELDGSVAMSQARPTGRLRIDMSVPIAQEVILPALAEFFARYPEIQVEIGASDRRTDLVSEHVDCVIRGGELTDQSLIARRIAELYCVTCATPAYLVRHPMPATPEDLEKGHEIVRYFNATSGRLHPFEFLRAGEQREVPGHHRAAVSEVSTYVAAGLAGLGMIQAPYFIVRDDLAAGRLVPVLQDWTVPSIPLFVVYPPNRHLSNKLRVFVDWVAELFASPRFAPLPKNAGSA